LKTALRSGRRNKKCRRKRMRVLQAVRVVQPTLLFIIRAFLAIRPDCCISR
jgi:hypothetical protein